MSIAHGINEPRHVARIRANVARTLASVTLLLPLAAAHAADAFRTTGDVAVYLGVLPAAMVLGHAPEHPEAKMHGGVPAGKRQHHVVIALFDTRNGVRTDNVEVSARVGPLGLAAVQKKLERMLIANTVSYGNYFEMSGTAPYRIEVDIRRPGTLPALQTRFDYTPPRP